MAAQLLDIVLVGGLIAFSLLILPKLLLLGASPSLSNFPLNGGHHGIYPKRLMAFLFHAEQLYKEGYAKFQHAIYRMTTVDGERLVIPYSYLEELRQRPDDEINQPKALKLLLEAQYTHLEPDSPIINHVIRADLTHNLPRINLRISKEVDRCMETELPPCDDWTPVVINQALLRIVAIVSGSIFIGPEHCRKEEYLYSSINFTVDVFSAVRALKRWPRFLRPIMQYFTPQLRAIERHKTQARSFLEPIIKERRAMMQHAQSPSELPDDALQWMLNKSPNFGMEGKDDEMAVMQLGLSMAAIHTTSQAATHTLFDIAANPKIIPELRKEISTVLESTNGVMTTQALFQMKLLDSVMKESQRLNPPNMARFARFVEKPVTLKDGTKLPAGVVVETPHIAITRDPKLFPNPNTFNPHRFANLRAGLSPDPIGYKNTEQYQFVTTTKENASFGYGRHACPGRFFAANEIKLIVARLLLDYDIRLPDGVSERYRNIVVASVVNADSSREVLLRKMRR
ncbi:ent-kaurene oxidase [Bombardia bombarda]|uniref:Ent-kaurene oxidase n=1 Tax=Bombardia bombarda TaxID=252184 RepID=A0AA39XAQ6_9PEZI|nr:ent-kaurene oxidase [Bombardia bombarda]